MIFQKKSFQEKNNNPPLFSSQNSSFWTWATKAINFFLEFISFSNSDSYVTSLFMLHSTNSLNYIFFLFNY